MRQPDQSLSKVSYYQIGGPAKVLCTPRTVEDLEAISLEIRNTACPFFILGWGSNLLFSDDGFSGIVIRMKYLFNGIEELPNHVLRVGAGTGASTLLRQAQEKGYGGLERLTGIPGSVGGMVAMNAGTHLGEIKDLILRVDTVRLGEYPLRTYSYVPDEGSFSYRKNHFLKPNEMVTHVEIRYRAEEPSCVRDTIDELYRRRKETQPVEYPSCGSVFMNPKGKSGGVGDASAGAKAMNAWQVIDQLGLRGHRIGNARFSEKHSNFIVNLGGATAHDVLALIELAQKRAKEELGILLETEVKIVR